MGIMFKFILVLATVMSFDNQESSELWKKKAKTWRAALWKFRGQFAQQIKYGLKHHHVVGAKAKQIKTFLMAGAKGWWKIKKAYGWKKMWWTIKHSMKTMGFWKKH